MKPIVNLQTLLFLLLLTGFVACQGKQSREQNALSKTPGNATDAASVMPNPAQTLREAALEGNLPLAQAALEKVTDADDTDEEGHTALMLASYNGHTAIAEALLQKGADVNLIDSRGLSALHFASSGPFVQTVELLLSHGALIDLPDDIEQFTPLMYAASEGHAEVVKTLLDHHADITLKDKDGDTAENFAAQNNHPEIAALLKSLASK